MRDVIRGLVEKEAGLDYAAVMIPTNARSFIHITLVIFDTKDEAETRRAYDTAKLLVREAAKHGYGEYRAHLDFMDLAPEQYVQRPRLPALRRDDQGRGRPERDPLAGQAGDLAASMRNGQ